MRIREVLKLYVFQRNWHYTFNRRFRKWGWDLRPWPNHMALFGFNPELSDLISQTSADDMNDLGNLLEGISLLLKANGRTYSQLCQEAFVIAHTKGKSEPRYLEVGAFHPEKYSNTASLREYRGWVGLSVDPSEDSRKAFESAGLAEQFLNVGVGAASGFAYFSSDGAFSHTHTEETEGSIRICVIGIVELVEMNPNVDYVSLDIEGGELEIIRAFPWGMCKPKVFTIEHNQDLVMKKELNDLMAIQGYRRVLDSVTNFDSWFLLEN